MVAADTSRELAHFSHSFAFHDGEVRRVVTSGDREWSSARTLPSRTAHLDGAELASDWWRSFLHDGLTPAPSTASPIRTVDLFSGPGGLSLGFAEAASALGTSVTTLVAADSDAAAVDIHAQNHETATLVTDSVDTLVDSSIRGEGDDARWLYPPEMLDDRFLRIAGSVDAVLAGPPCQGHSNLNNRTRRTDTRNELYLSVPAIAVALDAPIVVIENVPSVVHDQQGVVATTKRLLETSGYHVTTAVLSAAKLGWPQTRSRFFMVATRHEAPSLEQVADLLADQTRDLDWAIGDLVGSVGSGGRLDELPDLNDDSKRRIDWLFDNDEYDLANHQRPECHQDGTTYVSVYGRLRMDRPAQTITTGFMTPGRGRYVHPTERRVITPHEAARLQGFPDTYRFQPRGQTDPAYMRQLGKWIGDAVPTPLGYAAGLCALVGSEAVRSTPAAA